MVNPLIVIAMYLAAIFLIALVDKISRSISLAVMFMVFTATSIMSVWQIWFLNSAPDSTVNFATAGFAAPLSIVLRFGYIEAILVLAVNFIGLLGAIYLSKEFCEQGAKPIALYITSVLGATGLILTRDIFNTFVFLEILSIATYALIAIKQDKNSLAAGIKYMLAGGLSSSMFLIGVVFAYRFTGTLNIDIWLGMQQIPKAGYEVAMFLLAMGLFVELKPFPANGWALDLYQSVHSGLGAIVSTINTAALLYVFYKVMPLFSSTLLAVLTGAGLASFLMANLVALRQKDAKRLLGYSSSAQTGLIIFSIGAMMQLKAPVELVLLVAMGLLITNMLAKAGLFWLSGMLRSQNLSSWTDLKKIGSSQVFFAVFIIALAALPPFPAFFAKWQLVQLFGENQAWIWLGGLLLGSLLEIVYLFRWMGEVFSSENMPRLVSIDYLKLVPLLCVAVILTGVSLLLGRFHPQLGMASIYPILVFVLFGVVDFLSVKIKGIMLIGISAYWGWYGLLPSLPLLGQVFIFILIGGSIAQIFGFMRYRGAAEGMFPALAMLIFALGNLVIAGTKLEFFMAWELMTLGSYFLVLRGKQGKAPALSYIVFSSLGAYLLMAALSMIPNSFKGYPLIIQTGFLPMGELAGVLALLAFLIKIGAAGLHYWLPGAYCEADDESSSILSSVLSKAGVYGLMLLLLIFIGRANGNSISMIALGWLGVATAFFGALMAVFQEDAKKLLAYSSMSQMGYIIAGFSLMSHLGWVSAVYLAVNHMFFKALIFMAMAGVFLRTGTRNMYEMGGLIKKMPIAFISVLIGIITVSGVPPLSGFGSKWFIYTSLIEQGRVLQAAMAFFSSAISFLYLYKLIHAVFLGQAKPQQSLVKEAPIWLIIPQGIFIMAIMAISLFPNLITKTLSLAVGDFISKPDWLVWDGYNMLISSPLLKGNWNGNLVMLVTMGVFITPLIWLILVNARAQKVKQFNIVYAAERPYKPWTTHVAYNMFAHYDKALGFLVKPRITGFYNSVAEWTHSLASTLSRLYTGNGQTYILHIFLYMLFLYSLLGVN